MSGCMCDRVFVRVYVNFKHLLVKFEKFNLVSLLLSLMLLNVRTSTLIYILKFILCSPEGAVAAAATIFQGVGENGKYIHHTIMHCGMTYLFLIVVIHGQHGLKY